MRIHRITAVGIKSFITTGLLFLSISAYCQKPPRPITVVKNMDLAFGAFYQGPSGGSVSINKAGIRTSPDCVLFGGGYSPAVFRITGRPGTLVTPDLDVSVILNGSTGGSMSLQLDNNTNPASPFILSGVDPVIVDLYIGGTLTVGTPALSPPGSYTGTIIIIFHQN